MSANIKYTTLDIIIHICFKAHSEPHSHTIFPEVHSGDKNIPTKKVKSPSSAAKFFKIPFKREIQKFLLSGFVSDTFVLLAKEKSDKMKKTKIKPNK